MVGKIYGAMIAAENETFIEEIWKDIDEKLIDTNDKFYFFCGKPLKSAFYDEKYENVVFGLMENMILDGLVILSGTLAIYAGKIFD